jgi:hypothetical protein
MPRALDTFDPACPRISEGCAAHNVGCRLPFIRYVSAWLNRNKLQGAGKRVNQFVFKREASIHGNQIREAGFAPGLYAQTAWSIL